MAEALEPPSGAGRLPAQSPHAPAPEHCESDRDKLFREFVPFVTRFARRHCADADMRAELLGEAYLCIAGLVERYDPRHGVPLRPYLVCNLRWHLFALWRTHRRRQSREVCLNDHDRADPDRFGNDPTDAWISRLERERLIGHLPNIICEIPARQRNALVWRYYEGLEYEAIAIRLGVKEATARSLLRHAVNGLRRQLVDA